VRLPLGSGWEAAGPQALGMGMQTCVVQEEPSTWVSMQVTQRDKAGGRPWGAGDGG